MPEGSNVLIVDPDEERRERLRVLFQPSCPMVRVAENFDAAMVQARDLPMEYASAAVVDIAATAGDPRALVEALKAASPTDLVVVLLTNIDILKPKGIDDVLYRDVQFERLRNVVINLLIDMPLRRITEFVVTLIALQSSDRGGTRIVDGGTGCLIETAHARFVLTAGHVVTALQRRDVSWIMGGMGNVSRVPSLPIVLGVDDSRDIGTVALPYEFDPGAIGRKFYKPPGWPPQRAITGEIACFVGFPGAIRSTRKMTINTRGMMLTSRVASATRERFILTADEDAGIQSNGPVLTQYGGISGAPVFVSRERGLTLVGVVNQGDAFNEGVLGPDGQPARRGAAFYAAHADEISETGALRG